ncbi:Calcium-transporting ATPase 12, plasma membrane-type [Vitis vinifera]|uniref:Calcium-transporting ATPase 12, plasma membrane-type n=1 Tax=Vitis vinifera TaxID=29760 RepID=A0A438IED9_VITVI|nr:Calcium-transporting ATPase 12, plasma membrane-type [Vitis vinifera]
MSGVRHEQRGCDGGGDGEQIRAGILVMHIPTRKYCRLWRRDWTVRRFVALCKKASIPTGPSLLSVAPLLQSQQLSRASSARSMLTYNDNGVPSLSSAVPLLQSEEPNEASSAGSHSALGVDSEQLNGDSSAPSHLGVDSDETSTENRAPVLEFSKQTSTDNGSPSMFQRLQSQLSRASSVRSQFAIDPKRTNIGDHGAPSPSSTVPLLQSEEPNEASSAGSHSALGVDSEQLNGDSSAPSHLGVDSDETSTENRAPVLEFSKQTSTDNGSPSMFQRLQSQLSRASSVRSQFAIDPKRTNIGDHGAPSPSSTVPLLQSEEPNEASYAGSHSAMGVPGRPSTDNGLASMFPVLQPSSTGSNLTLDLKNTSTGNGSPSVLRVWESQFRGSASSSQSQLAIEPKKIYSTGEEAPSPSSMVPLRQSESAQTHSAIDVQSDNAEDEELQRTIARIFEEKNLNWLREFGGAERLAFAFGSNLVSGKNTGFGESRVTYKKQVLAKDFPGFFVRACNSYTIFLLIISACFSLVFEMVEKSPKNGWHDGAATFLAALFIVTMNSGSSFRQARKREKNMLNERRIEVTVIRSGQRETVPIYGIVKGDLLCLRKDQTVPADGLLVYGSIEVDGRSDKNIDCHQNPFLFSGSMVVGGDGHMLVTSVGSNVVSFKEALLEARISKPNTCAEFFSLCMALLIVLVLFLRFLHKKHHYHDGGSSNIKGEITVQGVLKIFERMLLKPRGTISILTSFLAAVVIGIQHGMPFVISISLAYWNEKKATDDLVPQNLSACGTMGLVTVICIDLSGGLIGEEEASEMLEDEIDSVGQMKKVVRTFQMAGVDVKLVSGMMDLEGQDIRNHNTDELKRLADGIKVMAKFLPKDKLSMVQCLKENGHVVAFYGGSTAKDALVLKEADVGISDEKSTEMAKKSSDIIISSYKGFISLIQIWKYGIWAYHNIQKFIQHQLTVNVSSLVITSVATMALGESPITLIQLIWVNLVTSILGGLMLIMEPKNPGTTHPPSCRRVIKAMNGRVIKAMIFNSFALCQVFNYVNAMDLEKKWSGQVKQKGCLLVAEGAAVAVQVLVAEIWARLNWVQWAFCFLIAALSWGLGLAMKALSPFMINCFDQLPAVLPWFKMRILDLTSNMLQGSLPVSPSSTFDYSVSGNELSGQIPPLICNMSSLSLLQVLVLGNNLINDISPRWWGSLF